MIVLFGWFVALSAGIELLEIILVILRTLTVNKWMQFSIVAIAIYFAYISTEKYEVCHTILRQICNWYIVEGVYIR